MRHLHWVTQRRNPTVFVRGKIRHADHKTIVLNGWHQVLMNTETQAVAMRHVAFIDYPTSSCPTSASYDGIRFRSFC